MQTDRLPREVRDVIEATRKYALGLTDDPGCAWLDVINALRALDNAPDLGPAHGPDDRDERRQP